jgi:phosphatidylinositol glycan class U
LTKAIAPLLFILLDYGCSRLLKQLASFQAIALQNEDWPEAIKIYDDLKIQAYETTDSDIVSKPKKIPLDPEWISNLYLMNPLSIAACIGLSSGLFSNFFTLLALSGAIQNKPTRSMLSLALSTYLSFYPIVFLPICLVLLSKKRQASLMFLFFCTLFLMASYALIGSWNFLESTYGVLITVSDLTPNIGLYWYFFIEVFETFKLFFICLFQFVIFIFIIPTTIRFYKHPLFTMYVLATILAILKPYFF